MTLSRLHFHVSAFHFEINFVFLFVTSCQCPRNRINTGPLCETVRVNFENLQTALTAVKEVIPSLPLHISLEFICKDFRGTGVLFTLGDYVGSHQIFFVLYDGRTQ